MADFLKNRPRLTEQERKKRANNSARRNRAGIRKAVFEKYGNKCMCCGEKELAFLTMDHIEGNGADHRRELGKYNKGNGRSGFSSTAFYRWLLSNGCPSIVQILCFNCNCAKHYSGECPHKKICADQSTHGRESDVQS